MNHQKTKKRKSNPWVILTSVFVFLAGVGIFLYPTVSNWMAEHNQSEIIHSYQDKVSEFSGQQLAEEWEKAVVYNENLTGDPVHDPFVMGSGYVIPENYEETLNLNGDGVMCYLEIPKIGVNLPVYHGASEEVLEKGAGHLEATTLPIGGQGRHSVISAHRGLPSAELFTRLDEMEAGDVFYIHVLDQTLAYEVDQIETILPEELEKLAAEDGKDLVTLLTCTPYAVNTHRLLVRGSRTEYVQPDEEAMQDSVEKPLFEGVDVWYYYLGIAIGLAVLGVGITAIVIVRKRRKKRMGKEP
ncbi:class C sortase [Solibaculum mannosilyticum]|uniref:Class C sortase n=1 Tax=Solibaculum mannosilyticum TaxID=2780922 RepID=A0A7I8D1X1_9FIRM|nr:class C sortase [Solibaculum mannosilyticum]BCI59429.1 class C sortase [Solibaculum mannosilyticum]